MIKELLKQGNFSKKHVYDNGHTCSTGSILFNRWKDNPRGRG